MEINKWQQFWTEGDDYLRAVKGGLNRPEKFNPEMIYNIAGMSIEGFTMAWLGKAGNLPENHSLRDLVRAIDKVTPLPEDLRKRLLAMDRFQDLCPMIPIEKRIPVHEDSIGFVALVEDVREFFLLQGWEEKEAAVVGV